MSVVLGIDLATAELRVQAVEVETGRQLAERRAALPVRDARGGPGADGAQVGARVQPARHGMLTRQLITAVAADLGERAAEVRALSITGTSGTVVPADAEGRPTGDAVLYDDPRGRAELAALAAAGIDRRPLAALARAAVLHAETPAERYLFTPDVVAAALAGRLLPSDTSHALKSGIDPVTATWDEEALEVLGLPRERMPELVRPGTVIGEVADPQALGLPAGVLIVAGMTDGSTGQIATGAVAEGDTVGVLGTTLVLKAVSRREVIDTAAGIYSHGAPDGLFWPGGASNTGAGVLSAGVTAGVDPAAATAAIDRHGPADVVMYPLARPGERFPVADPAFAGFTLPFPPGSAGSRAAGAHPSPEHPTATHPGVHPPTPGAGAATADDPTARFRAVFEGVAFVERLGLQRLAELGVESRRHHLAGGATASDLWNRIRASALGRPVIVVEGAGSGRGAAVIAAAAVTGEPLAAVAERFSGARSVVEPDPALVSALDERYAVFRDAAGTRCAPPPPPV